MKLSEIRKIWRDYESMVYVSGHLTTKEYVSIIIDLRQERTENQRLREALEAIATWSDAYPLDVFPEPDFEKAHKLLQAGGMTLDAISASNMRHVVEEVGKIAKKALENATQED